jgi:predicted O-methyltransferase YrrM
VIGRTFIHYLGVLLGSRIPQTQTTEAERDLLKAHLPGRKRIVEVGVFEGFTTRMLADCSDPDATVYGVDPFFSGRFGVSWGFKIACAYNHNGLATGKVKLIRTLSTYADGHVPHQVDYVFVDADHSLDAIKADWAFWSARLAPGGVIALHDTVRTPGGPEYGSHQYFRSHIQYDRRFELIGQKQSLSVLRKRQS